VIIQLCNKSLDKILFILSLFKSILAATKLRSIGRSQKFIIWYIGKLHSWSDFYKVIVADMTLKNLKLSPETTGSAAGVRRRLIDMFSGGFI